MRKGGRQDRVFALDRDRGPICHCRLAFRKANTSKYRVLSSSKPFMFGFVFVFIALIVLPQSLNAVLVKKSPRLAIFKESMYTSWEGIYFYLRGVYSEGPTLRHFVKKEHNI